MHIEKLKAGNESLYVIKKESEEVGRFILSEQGNGVKQLRNLKVEGNVSKTGILYVFELIQSYLKEENIKEVQVKSHSTELDTLLDHQQFVLKDKEKQLWTYRIKC
ncbi:hypothetical protein LF817_17945 [Halobacillus sp. A1]|uniref:hypothetical protein n=1 Tax=Halobacillus sp. A1 TaxID=2880262 RepID=UPI0020A6BEA1|nr:hypothetical protein [Halobacillus sp. A1]MCP3033212.1 hypothetical protein [Halobacillus sp. A1]